MKLRCLLAFAVLAVSSAYAAVETVPVVYVEPVNEQVLAPRRVCTYVQQQQSQGAIVLQTPSAMNGGTVTGAVVGGALGDRLASRGNHPAGILAGALLGGFIGNQVYANSNTTVVQQPAPAPQLVESCSVVNDYVTQTYYIVTYDYNGRRYNTRMGYNPGATIRVDVSIRPLQ